MVLETEALVLQTWVVPKEVGELMGSWAWIMLLAKPAFHFPHQVYRGLHTSTDRRTPRKCWEAAKGEFVALASLPVFMVVRLDAPWHDKDYMTDSSGWGYWVISTGSTSSESRAEARWCDL